MTAATAIPAPPAPAEIEQVFLRYFQSQGLATEPTPFDGRSDYGPFIAEGIPAGGLFSGAEGVKTPEQVALYGGEAGVAFDHCYHEACDDISNVNTTGLDQLADGAAHAVAVFAYQRTMKTRGKKQSAAAKQFKGGHKQQ